jgi:glycine oxidase
VGTRREASVVVVAAGAWVPGIDGLPRALPVTPVRGQMVSFDAAPLGHVVYGPEGYVVPRGSRTVAGSTMERVGFAVGTTTAGVAGIVRAAGALCPPLAGAFVGDTWSGLRPVTPDLLPIIGRDPEYGGLLYACGHSRNGILLAPLTGDCIAALATGEEPEWDLAPFRVERFG